MKTKFSLFAPGQDSETGLNFSIPDFDLDKDLKALGALGLLDYPKQGAYHLKVGQSLYFVPYLFLDEILFALAKFDYEESFWNLSPCGPSEYLTRKADKYSHIQIYNDKTHEELTIKDFPLIIKRQGVVFNANYIIWGKSRFDSYVEMCTGFGEFLLSDLYAQLLDELARV